MKNLLGLDAEFIVLKGKDGTSVKSYYTHLASERSKLLHEAKAILAKPKMEEFTHFIIMTHGNTFFTNELSETGLEGIGSILENGLDKEATEFFKVFQGRFKKNASVFLNSCSTTCGSESQVRLRAESLMNYLGISNGKFYGSKEDLHILVPPENLLADKFYKEKTKYMILDVREVLNFIAIAATVPPLLSFIFDQISGTNVTYDAMSLFKYSMIYFIDFAAFYQMAFYGLKLKTKTYMETVYSKIKSKLGYVVKMKDGKAANINETNETLAFKELFNQTIPLNTMNSCRYILL